MVGVVVCGCWVLVVGDGHLLVDASCSFVGAGSSFGLSVGIIWVVCGHHQCSYVGGSFALSVGIVNILVWG